MDTRPSEPASQGEGANAADEDQTELERNAQVAEGGERDDNMSRRLAKKMQRVEQYRNQSKTKQREDHERGKPAVACFVPQ